MREGKGRNRTGSLYRRWRGKKCRVDDAGAKESTIYLKYTVGGKTIETSLGTSKIKEAKKKQQEIMKPLELAIGLDSSLMLEDILLLEKLIGVGKFSSESLPVSITTAHADFNKKVPHRSKQQSISTTNLWSSLTVPSLQ